MSWNNYLHPFLWSLLLLSSKSFKHLRRLLYPTSRASLSIARMGYISHRSQKPSYWPKISIGSGTDAKSGVSIRLAQNNTEVHMPMSLSLRGSYAPHPFRLHRRYRFYGCLLHWKLFSPTTAWSTYANGFATCLEMMAYASTTPCARLLWRAQPFC